MPALLQDILQPTGWSARVLKKYLPFIKTILGFISFLIYAGVEDHLGYLPDGESQNRN
jgi:hypothetical protein